MDKKRGRASNGYGGSVCVGIMIDNVTNNTLKEFSDELGISKNMLIKKALEHVLTVNNKECRPFNKVAGLNV